MPAFQGRVENYICAIIKTNFYFHQWIPLSYLLLKIKVNSMKLFPLLRRNVQKNLLSYIIKCKPSLVVGLSTWFSSSFAHIPLTQGLMEFMTSFTNLWHCNHDRKHSALSKKLHFILLNCLEINRALVARPVWQVDGKATMNW